MEPGAIRQLGASPICREWLEQDAVRLQMLNSIRKIVSSRQKPGELVAFMSEYPEATTLP